MRLDKLGRDLAAAINAIRLPPGIQSGSIPFRSIRTPDPSRAAVQIACTERSFSSSDSPTNATRRPEGDHAPWLAPNSVLQGPLTPPPPLPMIKRASVP